MSVRKVLGLLFASILAALLFGGPVEVVSAGLASAALLPPSKGELSVRVQDAESGQPLASRLRLASSLPLGGDQVIVAGAGELRRELAPGRYQLLVTHGPEWSIAERTLEVEAGRTTSLVVALTRLVDGSAFTACDLHVHTAASPDSTLLLAERADSLRAEDVHFAVITDHNTVTDAAETLAARGIGTLPAVEVTTWAPEFGHFNVFPRASPPRHARSSARALLEEVRRDPSAFIQINHPRLEHHIGYFELGGYERSRARAQPDFPLAFDAIEVWNGYDLGSAARRDEILHDWLALTARGQRIVATGGSDAHAATRPPFVGYPRTYVQLPRAEAQRSSAVLAALKAGRSFVTNGPLIVARVEGKGPGDVVQVKGRTTMLNLEVELTAPAWMEMERIDVWLGGQLAASATVSPTLNRPSTRTVSRFALAHRGARSLVVTARGRGSMRPLLGISAEPFAFTNPIWVERG